MNKKIPFFTVQTGLTLAELVIVVIIIAALAAIAYPQFARTIEAANGREARVGLELIFAREQMVLAQTGGYIFCGFTLNDCNLKLDINLKTDNWVYVVIFGPDPSRQFVAVAQRRGGIYEERWIKVDEIGQWIDNWPLPY